MQKWQARKKQEKLKMNQTKLNINEYLKKMDLIVDVPKQDACNTNDGHSWRGFFCDPEL